MSNIQKTIQFLTENPDKHFITITNQDNSQPVGSPKLFLRDIANSDLVSFLKYQLGATNSKTTRVWVELRKVNGTSSQKVNSFAIDVEPVVVEQKQEIITSPSHYNANVHHAAPFGLGNPVQQFGLGLGEIMKMNTDSALLADKIIQYDKLEKQYEELKHEKRLMEIDLRQALTDVSKAEAKETLAIMTVKAENRGFFDSPAFQTLMEKAPEMLANVAAMKAGQAPVGLGNPDWTETQKEFISYVTDNLNDDQIAFLGSILRHMGNTNFSQAITTLLKQFDATS